MMKKRFFALLLVLCMVVSLTPVLAEKVTLTMGSWRNDDAPQVQKLLDKYEELTGVKIVYQPTVSAQYNATLRLQLDNGTGPDLMDARSFAVARELFDAGFWMDLSDLPGIKENFTDANRSPWQNKDGKQVAVPYAAVSQVVFYNKDIFAKYDLKVPETFEDLLALCQTLKDKGEQPLANGLASNWDVLECVFLGMLPNYVGGLENRLKYESGELKMDDENFVNALKDFEALTKFFPEGFEAVKSEDGAPMLGLGRAAMFFTGSWDINQFANYPAQVGTFAIPARKGAAPAICFHADMGVAGNANTKHPEEVKAYLAWVASLEGAKTCAEYMSSGFFPMLNGEIKLENATANEILSYNKDKITDSRFIWDKFNSLYQPILDQLNAIALGKTTPEAAAAEFAALQAKVVAGK